MYVFVFGVVAMGAKQIVPGTKCETREMRNNTDTCVCVHPIPVQNTRNIIHTYTHMCMY